MFPASRVVSAAIIFLILFSGCVPAGFAENTTGSSQFEATQTLPASSSRIFSDHSAENPADSSERAPALSSPGEETGFFSTAGQQILDPGGRPYLIRGIAFCNGVYNWNSEIDPDFDRPWMYADESTYREVAELGFNSVRFYMNQNFFHHPDYPGQYDERAFAWLDQCIAWAKKYDIALVLNMHIPHRGEQKTVQEEFWATPAYRDALVACWKTIAERYRDEPAIIGYGLLNEPNVTYIDSSTQASVRQYQNLMQRITDAIREVDSNHIVFVERVYAVVDRSSGRQYFNPNQEKGFVLVDDTADNMALEFHYYHPWPFVSIAEPLETDEMWRYPNSDMLVLWGSASLDQESATVTGKKFIKNTTALADGWIQMTSDLLSLSPGEFDGFHGQIGVDGLGGGSVYVDDIVISKYKDGAFVKEMLSMDFDGSDSDSWSAVYALNGSGESFLSKGKGVDGSNCLKLQGDASSLAFQPKDLIRLAVRGGYSYRISAKIKIAGNGKNTACYPMFVSYRCDQSGSFSRSNLAAEIQSYLDVGAKYNVPLYVGEFAVAESTMHGRNGQGYLSDLIDVFTEKGVHFNYHAYRSLHYALYVVPDLPLPYGTEGDYNEELAKVFRQKLLPLKLRSE